MAHDNTGEGRTQRAAGQKKRERAALQGLGAGTFPRVTGRGVRRFRGVTGARNARLAGRNSAAQLNPRTNRRP